MENNSLDHSIRCVKCGADVPEGNKFCKECGNPLIRNNATADNTCPQCNTTLESGVKFCTECGTKIEGSTGFKQQNNCPYCDANLEPGMNFCTECGKNINDKSESLPQKDDWFGKSVNILSKSGKGLMKDVDILLNSASQSIDDGIKPKRKSSNKLKMIKPKRIRGVEYENPGFLVCNECGGFYKLKSCEGPGDFSDICECGGTLKHLKRIPKAPLHVR